MQACKSAAKPQRQQRPQARAPARAQARAQQAAQDWTRARAERRKGSARGGKVECCTVLYTKVFVRIEEVVQEDPSDHNNSVLQASVQWLLSLKVYQDGMYTHAQNVLM